ncbi:MAG: ROK family protein [Christensenellales bacterium]|jgi:predicted NBD/HSP70 family sugar kinase
MEHPAPLPAKGSYPWQVLSYIMRNGPRSRKVLAEQLQVTAATLTHATTALIQAGMLREAGVADERRVGRKQVLLDLAPGYRYALGLDVANTYLRVTLLDMGLRLVDSRVWRYETLTEEVLEQALRHGAALAETHAGRVLGVGLLAQGFVDQDRCSSLPIQDLKERVARRIPLPITLMNNIRGLAIAQSFFDSARENFLLMHYGPGVCAVAVSGGRILPGAHNRAGEIGHTLWDPDSGQTCRVCGRKGCLESLIHFDAVARRADPAWAGRHLEADELLQVCRADGGEALGGALDQLASATALLASAVDPEELLLSGQLFTHPEIYRGFVGRLAARGCPLPSERIGILEGYADKRVISAGLVVFDGLFGGRV